MAGAIETGNRRVASPFLRPSVSTRMAEISFAVFRPYGQEVACDPHGLFMTVRSTDVASALALEAQRKEQPLSE